MRGLTYYDLSIWIIFIAAKTEVNYRKQFLHKNTLYDVFPYSNSLVIIYVIAKLYISNNSLFPPQLIKYIDSVGMSLYSLLV